MADLVVLGFDNRRDAEEVFELGAALEGEELLDLEDAALAWRDGKGKVRIQQAIPTTRAGAATGAFSGALWGTLLGLLFLNPLAGLAVGGLTGAAAGATAGALTDIGINDDLIRHSTPDRVTEALKRYHPTVLYTNLTKDREEDLVKALQR